MSTSSVSLLKPWTQHSVGQGRQESCNIPLEGSLWLSNGPLVQQILTEHLLCAWHCSKYQGTKQIPSPTYSQVEPFSLPQIYLLAWFLEQDFPLIHRRSRETFVKCLVKSRDTVIFPDLSAQKPLRWDVVFLWRGKFLANSGWLLVMTTFSSNVQNQPF